jgi:hypothetical protein
MKIGLSVRVIFGEAAEETERAEIEQKRLCLLSRIRKRFGPSRGGRI